MARSCSSPGAYALPARAVLGFSDLTHDGVRYRVYSLQTAEQTIQIAQDMDDREARARALAARAVLPMAVIAPLLMLALWLVIRRSLAPLERTRQQVAARALDDLSPLPEAGLPDEVRPLVQELNLLFGRLGVAVDAQQSFVAHAAHELRSPLTALKLQAQALERPLDPRRAARASRACTRASTGPSG
jgi:two-component system OmpR family sensor kinase